MDDIIKRKHLLDFGLHNIFLFRDGRRDVEVVDFRMENALHGRASVIVLNEARPVLPI